MKNLSILFIILIIPLLSFSQEIDKRSEIISSIQLGYLSYHEIRENNKITNEYLTYSFHNRKYQEITDIQTLFIGSVKEFHEYLDSLEKFLIENEPNTSTTIQGKLVTIDKLLGAKLLVVWDKDKLGYTYFSQKNFTKIKSKLDKWLKKNKN